MARLFHYTSDTKGAAAPIFAVSLMAIVGLVGATLALAMDGRAASNLQATADSSALAGATAFIATDSPRVADRLSAANAAASAVANSNSDYYFTNLEIAPLTEDAYGQHTEITVNMAFSPANPAAQVAGRNASIEIERTAVATATWGFPLCILSLAETGSGLTTSDRASLHAQNCIIWTNSTKNNSMKFNGGEAESKFFCAAGHARISGGTQVTPTPHEDCNAIPDPLEDWVAPEAGLPDVITDRPGRSNVSRDPTQLLRELDRALDTPILRPTLKLAIDALNAGELLNTVDLSLLTTTLDLYISTGTLPLLSNNRLDSDGIFKRGPAEGLSVLEVSQILGLIDNIDPDTYSEDEYVNSPTMTLNPGTYAGLDIAYGNVTLAPGVYHIVGAPLIVRRRATLIGEGVTIIFHGSDATFNVLDEARITLTGPESGDTAGFILAEDTRDIASKSKSKKISSRITGSGSIEAIGTVYLPSHALAIKGEGAADQTSPLLQIVADRVMMSDDGALDIVFAPGETNVPVAIQPKREARLIR